MQWRDHSKLAGTHSVLSPSNSWWLGADEHQIQDRYAALTAKERGTRLHEFAAEAISLGERLQSKHMTLNMYVNDAIDYRLSPEVLLYYSENCYGTADAIGYNNKKFLRIHDLKTGTRIEVKTFDQLLCYAALFCLEYSMNPSNDLSGCELRLYQFDDFKAYQPTANDIRTVMDRIIFADMVIEKSKGGNYYV